MCTKYHLDLYDHITVNDITLYRIIADKRISKDIKKGQKLTTENIKSIRPNNGLAPKYLNEILGKIATKDLKFGEPLKWDSFK